MTKGVVMLDSAALDALARDSAGVTAIEYGLIAGAVAVAIIASVLALGGDISSLFGATGSAIGNVPGSTL